jgi:hypothetical protein
MAEIVAFNPSTVRTKRLVGATPRPLGEVVFFTGVRYERWISPPAGKTKLPPPKSPRLKSKACP